MKLSLRILLGYLLIVGVGAWFVGSIFMDEVKPGVRKAMEDTLIDTAHVLARLAASDLGQGRIADGEFAHALTRLDQQPVLARVWESPKRHIDYRVHVTDVRGVVVFDSAGEDVGRDFSRWNDIHLTLSGRYGARSTRTDPEDDTSTVMHVAAPIRDAERLIGVLSVAKPNRTVAPFIEQGRRKILMAGLWLLALSLLIGGAVALWITGSVGQLLRYAERVSRGERAEPPDLGSGELATLSQALAGMREKLEGKQYVERYVHALTHEMKSPLTAIGGAAELLGEDLPATERRRFADNIRQQSQRLGQLVERMLGLASVESRQRLEQVGPVALAPLVEDLLAERKTQLESRGLTIDLTGLATEVVQGDRFLLGQALGNLLDNAMAFSSAGGLIEVSAASEADQVRVHVSDRGAGIPEFARQRVFERFFSLPRPDTGQKSTGLGLPFVHEVAELHRGQLALENRPGGGAVATLTLPRRGA